MAGEAAVGGAAGSAGSSAGSFMQWLGPLMSMFGGQQGQQGQQAGQQVNQGGQQSGDWGAGSQNLMGLASWLGTMSAAISGKDSPYGRVGAAMAERNNGGLNALALLEREKGNRELLSKLLSAHQNSQKGTDDALANKTPEQVGGGISNWFTEGRF